MKSWDDNPYVWVVKFERIEKKQIAGEKLKPILFSTEMVQAILAGRKTETRRVINVEKGMEYRSKANSLTSDRVTAHFYDGYDHAYPKCPYGKPSCTVRDMLVPGTVLWVRETWALLSDDPYPTQYIYAATDQKTPGTKWQPSIFMPKEACRIFLRIKEISVRRLHDITPEAAQSEGVFWHEAAEGYTTDMDLRNFHGSDPVISFQKLWQSING